MSIKPLSDASLAILAVKVLHAIFREGSNSPMRGGASTKTGTRLGVGVKVPRVLRSIKARSDPLWPVIVLLSTNLASKGPLMAIRCRFKAETFGVRLGPSVGIA